MTTDQAAEILATQKRTGNLSETARIVGVHKSTVSRHLAKNGIPAVKTQTAQATLQRKIKWIDLLSQRELAALKLLDGKGDDASYRDVGIVLGILDDKRYREEHPESVRGGEGAQVIVPVQIVIQSDSNV